MATAAYYKWRDAGSPYDVAQPIKELVALAKAAGVEVLGVIGDASHLTSNNPQDHTPFPLNPYPVPLPGYWVCAADFKNGAWAQRLLNDARAGSLPWLKYLNFGLHHYDVRDGWSSTSNSDEHLHVSVMSNALHTSIGSYNPFTGVSAPPPVEVDWGAAIVQTLPEVKRGSNGRYVRKVQSLANCFGAGLSEDSDFGPRTETAIRNIQKAQGIGVDGIVGPVTWRTLLTK